MWWEIVGWLSLRPAVKSQTQIGTAAFQSDASMVRRVGSASAFIRSEVWFAQLSLTRGRSQQAPRCLGIGSSLVATPPSYESHRHLSMDALGSTHRRLSIQGAQTMSDVKEAVRSRYAGGARQLSVLQPSAGAGWWRLG